MSKESRKKLAALSFTEKVKLLEKLRARSLAFAESREKLRSCSKDGLSTQPRGPGSYQRSN